MKYYELHEDFWKQLSDQGQISWDRESKDQLMFRERNFELKALLGDMKQRTALDLGSGLASQSFYLSSLGIKCTAVDISQTAIDIGKKLAVEMNLDIEFVCHDVCKLNLGKTFDVVTDSCLLHCLVTTEDRKDLFNVARKHMKEDGRLFVYTMIRNDDQKIFQASDYLFFDDEGILWSKGPERFDVEWTEINGGKYFPHRRIDTLEQQKNEILDNGFQIMEEKVIPGKEDENLMYVAWIKK